jgi:hypothetical protein
MSISDDIHEWADEYANGHTCDYHELHTLASRIDSEMVELPRSADGKIWTSYEVCFWINDGDVLRYHWFDNLVRKDGKWYVEDTDGARYEAKFAWHDGCPDSFESIADELDEMVDSANSVDDVCEKLADIADRIRKLAQKDDKQ